MVDEYPGGDFTKSEKDEALSLKKKGNEQFQKGNYEAALFYYNKGLELDPTNSSLWNNKGFSLFKLGRKEEAQKCKEINQELNNPPPIESKPPLAQESPIIKENPINSISTSIPPILQAIEEPCIPIQEKSVESPPTTANIYGISGSTQYLLNGIHPINGKKLTNLEEIIQFYNNYENILEETEITVRRQQDEKISDLSIEEARLDAQIKKDIAQRTREVEGNINNLRNKIKNTRKFFPKLKYQLQFLIENNLRSHRIKSPSSGELRELEQIRTRKANLISNKQKVIRNECNKVRDSYQFLDQNKTFFIGAHGEELVIDYLSQLSNEFHVLNDVNLHFKPAIYWREKKNYIISSQIDHIVIGPTGVFLIETKNWKSVDIDLKSEELIFQVRRSSYALWKHLVDYYRRDTMPKIWNIIVATHGFNSNQKLDKYIDMITPNQLSNYITKRERTLSPEKIQKLIEIVQCCR
jgi:tetratricopeptide (TPR) repeat protein